MIVVDDLVRQKTDLVYPNFVISKANDTLPVIVRSLEPGDIQLIVEYKGTRKSVATISPSAINVHRLLRCIGSIEYVTSKENSITISNVEEYLNLLR